MKNRKVSNSVEARKSIAGLTPIFRMPIVLMAQNGRGRRRTARANY
jgi:hypothetical protein